MDELTLTPEDQRFMLQLLQTADLSAILEINYKGLKVRLAPVHERAARKEANAMSVQSNFSNFLPKIGG